MATKQSTVDYLLEQLTGAHGIISSRKMFGEYALYCNGKVVALICDDKLFVKPTDTGRAILGEIHEAPPYPGAKMYFEVSEDRWEDREFLCGLITQTAAVLPLPKPKRKK